MSRDQYCKSFLPKLKASCILRLNFDTALGRFVASNNAFKSSCKLWYCLGGGQVVSGHISYSDNHSANAVELYSFYSSSRLKQTKINEKDAGYGALVLPRALTGLNNSGPGSSFM